MKKALSVLISILIILSALSVSFGVFAASKPADGWHTVDGKKYYALGGEYVKGICVIGNDFYFFNESTGVLKTNGWAKVKLTENSVTKTYWVYATDTGVLKEGWKKYSGAWYYLNPFMVDNDTCLIKGKVYAFESGGALTTKKGWFSVSRTNSVGDSVVKWTYVLGDGITATDWQKIGGSWYYFSKTDGIMTEDGVFKVDGKIYFFNSSGTWAGDKAGWVRSFGEWYYFVSGQGVKGWKQIKNVWYFFDRDTRIYNSDKTSSAIYYLEESGALTAKKGWIKYYRFVYNLGTTVTKWAYVSGDGICVTGWQKIGGKWYFFDRDDGEMYASGGRSVTSKGVTAPYFFEDGGALTTKIGWVSVTRTKYDGTTYTDWYYVNSDGTCQTGWQTIKSSKYYFDRDGLMVGGGVFVVDGGIYYFNASGALNTTKEGLIKSNGYAYYFVGGVGQTGWHTVDGIKRYFDPTMGYMYANGMFEVDGCVYSFNSSGKATKVS